MGNREKGEVPFSLTKASVMRTWIETLKSGLARRAPEDRIAGGKTYAAIGENLRRHLPFFRRHWQKAVLGAGFILLNALMAFPMPLVSRFVIDDVILGRQLSLLPWVLLLMAALALFSRAMGLFQGWFFLRYSQEVTLDIQKQVLDHSFRLPKSFFDRNQTGYLLARMTGDIGGVTWFLSGSLVGIVTNVLYFAGGLCLLFWLEWRLALAALAAVPAYLFALRRFSDRMHALNHAGNEENARYMSGFQETLGAMPLVKAFAAEEKAVGKIMAGLRQVFRLSAERSVVGSVTGLALSSTPSLVNFGVFAVGAWWVITGHWSLGSLFAFQAYLGRVFGPAQSLASTGLQVQGIRASLERLTALLDVEPEGKTGEGSAVGTLRGEVEFRNVTFAYDPKNPVLSDVSFRVNPGERVAVVGPSGAGKTTLLSLLLRFYNPTGGDILYDGKPARDYDVQSLRQRVGYVSQVPVLLSGTIGENLRYGNPGATDEEITRAARVAGIHDFIAGLPGGYDSEVGERGVNLSEGQKQRLAIARALVKAPDILVLDEPTAALDGLTEKSLLEALPLETSGKTLFVAAHRLSTVADCDRILVLNENRLVAEGTHEELLRTNEHYRQLVAGRLIPDKKGERAKVIPYESIRRHSRS
ncbi:MAG: putative ABC transporter ATP-binding protein [Syntrophaceae bacterium PtaU1.Bin231]|nr:MAG: putative ABC transporter ATP-binding protein [Syntrophaceae bacterium PtaU1.Bin231]